jgi:two-component system sensor histidine kinase PfeS
MQLLMEDTLTLSWLDTEKPKLNQETVDVTLLLDTIAEDARFEFPKHQLILLSPDSCPLEDTNHRALGQALENMIRNALKYSQEGSEVRVIVQRNGIVDELTISIEDQGPGVGREDLENIFKPFFRSDKSRNRTSLAGDNSLEDLGGFGLGLALSKRQITALGGSISAENMQPDGLRMLTRLPLWRR